MTGGRLPCPVACSAIVPVGRDDPDGGGCLWDQGRDFQTLAAHFSPFCFVYHDLGEADDIGVEWAKCVNCEVGMRFAICCWAWAWDRFIENWKVLRLQPSFKKL